jgi:hypothetical protein
MSGIPLFLAEYRLTYRHKNEEESETGPVCRSCALEWWKVTPAMWVNGVLNVEPKTWPQRLWVYSLVLDDYGWKEITCQEVLDDWLRRNPH